jgi:hypothetical protein
MKICDDHSCLVLLLPILAFLSLDMGYICCFSAAGWTAIAGMAGVGKATKQLKKTND